MPAENAWVPPEVAKAPWVPPEAAKGPLPGPASLGEGEEPDPDWKSLYSGLDGLESRVPAMQAKAFGLLDRSTNPKEARAGAINQAWVKARMGGKFDDDALRANWPSIRSAVAKEVFGMPDKDVSDVTLYGKIGNALKKEEEAAVQAHGEIKASDGPGMLHQLWEKVGVPLFDNPSLRPAPLHEPGVQMNWSDVPKSVGANVVSMIVQPGNLLLGGLSHAAKISEESQAAGSQAFGMYMAYKTAKAVPGAVKEAFDPSVALPQKIHDTVMLGLQGGMAGMAMSFRGLPPEVAKSASAEMAGKTMPEAVDALRNMAAKLPPDQAVHVSAVADKVEQTAAATNAITEAHEANPKAVESVKAETPEELPHALAEAAKEVKDPAEREALLNAADKAQQVAEGSELPPPDEAPKAETQPAEAKVEAPEPSKPAKPAAPDEALVGIKNEAVDEEMRRMGLEPAEHGAGLTWEEAKADAQAKLAADPMAGQNLVYELSQKPRPITGQEDALLLTEVNRARLARDSAEEELVAAKKANDPDATATAEIKIAKARDDFIRAESTATKVGTPQAQGLALRRMMMREDYSLASLERQLAAETKDGEITPEQEEKLSKAAKDIRKTGEDAQKHEAARLKAYKTRLKKLTEEYEAKTKAGDPSPRPKPEPIKLDPEGEMLKAAHERAKLEFHRMVLAERMKNRSFYEKAGNTLVKWRRGFLLSNPLTLSKLTAAAIWRVGQTYAEEALGAGMRQVPGLKDVAAKAPRYSGMNVQAEAQAITAAFTQGMRDAWSTLKTGHSDLDLIHSGAKDSATGENELYPRSVIDLFGNLHGALKAPVKRMEFARSFAKRTAYAIDHWVDVSNPLVQTKLALEAYADAKRAIFLQDNVVTEAYKRGMSAFENHKAASAAIRTALPIVKVPTNIVAETFESATGFVSGNYRLAKALRKGVENLPPEQADLIMRNLQKGTIGFAALWLGYSQYENFGGHYEAGEKRKKGELGPNEVNVFGDKLPSYLFHSPIMEAVQLGATVRRVANSKLRKKDKDTRGLSEGAMAGMLGLAGDIPFITDIGDLKAITAGGASGQYMADEYLKGLVVPQLLQFLAKEGDKDKDGNVIKRRPTNLKEHMETGIPGLRQKVPGPKGKASLPDMPVRIPAKDAKGRSVSLNLPAGKAEDMLSSRISALKKLRDSIPA